MLPAGVAKFFFLVMRNLLSGYDLATVRADLLMIWKETSAPRFKWTIDAEGVLHPKL